MIVYLRGGPKDSALVPLSNPQARSLFIIPKDKTPPVIQLHRYDKTDQTTHGYPVFAYYEGTNL